MLLKLLSKLPTFNSFYRYIGRGCQKLSPCNGHNCEGICEAALVSQKNYCNSLCFHEKVLKNVRLAQK